MSIRFNHTIVAARDRHISAAFFTHLFGLPEPTTWEPFISVRLDEGVFLQFAEPGINDIQMQHYAFLVDDRSFDKGGKDRMVPFPHAFRELLGLHIQQMQQKQACYLFESVRKHKYSDRGVRRMLERYAVAAGITRSLSPHKWRHFLFTWLKAQGVDDALIQPYSGHESRQSLEIYSRLSLGEAQPVYEQTMGTFPIQ